MRVGSRVLATVLRVRRPLLALIALLVLLAIGYLIGSAGSDSQSHDRGSAVSVVS